MENIIVYFDNFDKLQTRINGTKQEILDYYIGKTFNLGTETDLMVKAISVQFKPKFDKSELHHYVMYNKHLDLYEQMQLVKHLDKAGKEKLYVQKFDDELNFIHEIELFETLEEVVKHSKKICVKGLPCSVYKSKEIGDCTNNGISSKNDTLYLVSKDNLLPFNPKYIDKCIAVTEKTFGGVTYKNGKPLSHSKRWYMMGGNFLHTSDSRFKEITGINYPLPIHDRNEG